MAAHATHSSSGVASSSDDESRCLLLALSHDELGIVVDGLADPLQPVVAVAFSSTCLGLRTPLQATLEVLKERHERAVALCDHWSVSCAWLRGAKELHWNYRTTPVNMATLGMILRTRGLPSLQTLLLGDNIFLGDASVQAMCDGLGHGAVPSLRCLYLGNIGNMDNPFGPAGTEALAAAIGRGAMPKLEELSLNSNRLGNQGMATLAKLRKLPALRMLNLSCCKIGDDGVASLFGGLGKDDFKALNKLWLDFNFITKAGVTRFFKFLEDGALPKLEGFTLGEQW